jgi:hypothetical protein
MLNLWVEASVYKDEIAEDADNRLISALTSEELSGGEYLQVYISKIAPVVDSN